LILTQPLNRFKVSCDLGDILRKAFLVVFVVLVVVIVLNLGNLSGLAVLVALGDQGGKTAYSLQPIETFIQCFDGDPANLKDVKGVCHAQYYDSKKDNLRGINSVDYCTDQGEVVDFYCAPSFECKELVRACEVGFVCNQGACARESTAFYDLKMTLQSLFSSFRVN